MKYEKISQFGEFFTRIVIGVIFILAGYGKLFATPGIEGFSGMLGGLGFPLPGFLAILIGVIELVGGIMLLLGLWTTVSASLLSVIMLVAVITVHFKDGWAGYRYQLLLLVATLRYIGNAGFCSLAEHFNKK